MSIRLLHLQNETNASCPDFQGKNYRASFHTHSSAKGPRKKIYHGHLDGKGPRKGEQAVVKVFRSAPGTESMCDAEIEKHKLARRLAKRFNRLLPDDHYKVGFTMPLKSTVESLGFCCYLTRHKTRNMDKHEWVLIEENLIRQGEYQVFIRKTGERLTHEATSLDAFLHFTYQESGGQFVMCGLQGVRTESGYFLTTPCIHSVGSVFGYQTDKGVKGINKVFKLHRCNNICYDFNYPDLVSDDDEDNDTEDQGKSEWATIKSGTKQSDTSDEEGIIHDDEKCEEFRRKSLPHTDDNSGGKYKFDQTLEEKIQEQIMEYKEEKKYLASSSESESEEHRCNVAAVGGINKRPSV